MSERDRTTDRSIFARAWTDYLKYMRAMPLARVLLWLGLSLMVAVLALVFVPYPSLRLDFKDAITDVIQIATFLIAGLMVLFTMADAGTALRQEIYQRLEIESIALFRFNIANARLAAFIWDDGPKPEEMEAICLEDYVSQILNLFEMAIRFRKDDIVPHEAFGSWVIWINDLCSGANFRDYWRRQNRNLRWNYVSDLRKIIDDGLEVHHGKESLPAEIQDQTDAQRKTNEFFQRVAGQFENDAVIKNWFRDGNP